MKKILFLNHDLGQGGAEKVLVNLVNHLDRDQFDISVTAIFGGGINEEFLKPDVRFRAVFPRMIPGNSHLMKLLSPRKLYRLCVREDYDIVVSYLEGPSARVVSGCPEGKTKLACWIHTAFRAEKDAWEGFRSRREAEACYRRFHRIVAVSGTVRDRFVEIFPECTPQVRYNTLDTAQIGRLSEEPQPKARGEGITLCAVGTLKPVKGFDRLLRVHQRLRQDGFPVKTQILGEGAEKKNLLALAEALNVQDSLEFPGYQNNPYPWLKNADLFVCSSHTEGFSTAATEALILGVPVCSVEVSGMKEMLGQHREYGIVTENDEEALYQGVKYLLEDPARLAHYQKQAQIRGQAFRTEETVRAVEEMLLGL